MSGASAQSGTTVATPFKTGLTRVQTKYPFKFVGRVFDLDFIAFGSGTLLRRHTVLTAGHVLYDPTLGFTAETSFTRALYGNYQFQSSQVIKVATLGGYQSAVDTSGSNTSTASFQQDQGYVLLGSAPYDENWANFTATPSLLTNPANQFFILGYPGVGFDGRTQAYIVPQVPFVPSGTSATTGAYTNTDYQAIEGMSGGPILVETDDNIDNATVAADTVGGVDDTSGEFTISSVRVIDKTSQKFLQDAEYTSGLIKKVKVTGPATVTRGSTVTYTLSPVFLYPKTDGSQATTDRYSELKLKSTVVAIQGQAGITLKKLSNTTYSATFSNSSTLRSGSTITLQVYYDKATAAPGKSSKTIKIQ